jgi:hypothetical protein
MAKRKTAEDAVDLDTQIDKFIKVSADFSALKKIKETLSKSIKDLLGKRETYDSPRGEVTYGYNEDGEKEVVDMLKLQEKFPAAWKACVTKETVPGKRVLRMPGGDE